MTSFLMEQKKITGSKINQYFSTLLILFTSSKHFGVADAAKEKHQFGVDYKS